MAIAVQAPSVIRKRDGREVPFVDQKISDALTRCFAGFDKEPGTPIPELTRRAVNIVAARAEETGETPTVEGVQDIVEMILQASGEFDAAKHYILYRAEHERQRAERPIPEEVRAAFDADRVYFPDPLRRFQFFDKYSRFNYDLGRRETWIETVDRSVDFMHELAGDRLPRETYERVRRGILEMRAMPSMRLLAMAGAAARRNNIAIYNCSYQPVESIESFCEALTISMSGCGVGYSVESRYVEEFPRIKRQAFGKPDLFVVEDSAEGWVAALRYGMERWFDGGDVVFNTSLVRPSGTPLRIKGGRASGPEPLHRMLDFMRRRILSRQGSFLRPLDAHDMMCAVGSAAVSGGVRRTAMISLFDYDDQEMLTCKDGDFERENSQRWNANNSAVWPDGGPDQLQFIGQFGEMVKNGRGEPGIFNRQMAQEMRPARRTLAEFGTNPCVTADTWVLTDQGPRQVRELVGVRHRTVVHGQSFATTEDGFWSTGVKPVLRLKTREGHELRLTANHQIETVSYRTRKVERSEWREAGTLKPGDVVKLQTHRGDLTWDSHGTFEEGLLLGSLVGDGTFSQKVGAAGQTLTMAHLDFWGEQAAERMAAAAATIRETVGARSDLRGVACVQPDKYRVQSAGLARMAAEYGIEPRAKTVTPQVERASSAFYGGFLQGLFDADGSVQGTQQKGVSVRLAQSSLPTLQGVQRMLMRLGIASTIYPERRVAGFREMPDGHGGKAEYWTQANHELVIANDNIQEFAIRVGFGDTAKAERLSALIGGYRRQPNRETFSAVIESIEPDGVEEVFDCSVPGPNCFDANGFVAHNCGEIILRPWQFCNLTTVVAREKDTLADLTEKVELATIIGSIQSLAVYFPGLRPQWKANCEDERLLGVSIGGQMDNDLLRHDEGAAVRTRLRTAAVAVNAEVSRALGINQSASVTCVKPDGNSSQLLDMASGLHARWAPYYVRNVRVSDSSPLSKVLRDAGVPMSPENGEDPLNPRTWVASFPVKAPEGAPTRNDRTALQQCEFWLENKIHWTEHNPSVTITYRPDEVIDLMKWVWDHRDRIGGMAFLPSFDAKYEQLPYIEIDREEYERRVKDFPDVDFSKVYRYEAVDMTTAAQELACSSGTCEIE